MTDFHTSSLTTAINTWPDTDIMLEKLLIVINLELPNLDKLLFV